jgi:hypothetical protein
MRLSPEQFALQPLERDAAADVERLSQRLMDIHLEKRLKSYRMMREVLRSV